MSSSERNNSTSGSGMTIDIRPMIEDVSQVMTKHITNILSGVIGEYTIYKETHDTIMGLPCVRKLQERISELEQDGSGGGGVASAASASASRSGSREEEVAQLQSAIADLNRYIHALESKVNMKQVSSGDEGHNQQHHHPDEESVRLEIHETDDGDGDGDEGEGGEDHCESTVETSSTHKNVIITTEALEEAEDAEEADTEANAEAEEEDADAEEEANAEAEDTEADAEAEEADAEAAEEAPRNPRQERDRHEHGHERERGGEDGEADLPRALDRRAEGVHPLLLDEPVDVFEDDDRVVDDDTDRERQR